MGSLQMPLLHTLLVSFLSLQPTYLIESSMEEGFISVEKMQSNHGTVFLCTTTKHHWVETVLEDCHLHHD